MYRRILGSSFLVNFFTLLSGTIIAQLIVLSFSPVLTRLFTPAEFGIYAIFASFIPPLSTIFSGKYEQAIVIPDEDTDAINLYAIVIALTTVFSIALLIILFFFKGTLFRILKIGILGNWLYLVPLSLIFLSISTASSFWFIRKNKFKAVAINKISQTSFNIACSVPLGYIGFGKGLIVGDILGKFVLAVLSIFQTVKSGFVVKAISSSSILTNLKKFKHFPLYNVLPSFLVSLSLTLPIFLINSMYSNTQTGLVNQTRIAVYIPISLISAAISQVLLQRFTDKRKTSTPIMSDFTRIISLLCIVGIFIIIIIQVWGEPLFRLVFGKIWSTSGIYAKILVFSYIIQFIASPFSVTFIALDRIKILSFWQYLYFFSILTLFFIRPASILKFLSIYTIVELSCYLVYIYLLVRIIKSYEKSISK